MATTYSDIATKQNDPRMGNRPDGIQCTGTLHVSDVLYTIVGTEAAADIINLIKLPAGARVLTGLSYCEAENPGTALVLDIGDSDNADAYADGLTLSSGGNVAFSAGGTVAFNELNPQTTTEDLFVRATVMTATTLTADQTIRFVIVWSASN